MLSKNEQAALKFFVTELKSTIQNGDHIMLGWFVDTWNKRNANQKINDAGGRRIIRHIRDNGVIKRLMADRNGYFVAENRAQYDKYLKMIEGRMRRVANTYRAMLKQRR